MALKVLLLKLPSARETRFCAVRRGVILDQAALQRA
jgi:hypothetical protein